MTAYCYECYKKILKGEEEKRELIISKEPDLCPGCHSLKPIVLGRVKKSGRLLNALFGIKS